jgi:hypothetical protein
MYGVGQSLVVVSLLYVITYDGLLLVHEDLKKFSFRDVSCRWYDIVESVVYVELSDILF